MAVRTQSGRAVAGQAIRAITGIIVGFIVLSIVLVLMGANQGNMLVNFVLDIGSWLTTPFHDLFVRSTAKESLIVNWSIAAVFYLVIGGVLARLARW